MDVETFKRRLQLCTKIEFTPHARLRAEQRRIDLAEVEQNLRAPDRLVMVQEEQKEPGRFTCWFAYSNSSGHRYTIHINDKVRVITIIKIRPRWQREVEKHAQKIPRRLRY